MINDLILNSLSSFIKLVFLLPFFNTYILNKRIKKITNEHNSILKIGLIMVLTNIILIITINVLGNAGLLGDNQQVDLKIVYQNQIIGNIILLIGYYLLFKATNKMLNKKITKDVLLKNTLILIFFSITFLLVINDLIKGLLILSYNLTIIILFLSFNNIHKLMKKLLIKRNKLILISSIIILIDPILYTINYNSFSGDFESFNKLRLIAYLTSSIAMLLLSIPNIKFFLQLRKEKKFKISKKDSIIEKTIKELYKETQKIYGTITGNLHLNACASFYQENGKNVVCDGLNFKNLSKVEQKDYLKILLRIYVKAMGKELVIKIINNIVNKDNKSLFEECFPYRQDKLPEIIQPDNKMIKN